ncbi:MAG: ABC transporter permease [Gemmatimonadetes bacterium]|nr:ABC transporter permease [Gemmatimonadota bacterium]|tara:strand:+ start:2041 stop:2817 length:777 start_codon:yes stop_codon:yes gene_type:complete
MEFLFRPIGRKVGNFLTHMYHMSTFFARMIVEFRHFFFYRRQVIDQCYSVGVGSFSLVCLVSAFSGMAVAIQMAYQMEAYVPDYMVGSIVVRSVVLELAPVLMGLVLAGRVGAGIASELGTMKVSEQVDALTSMAVDPIGYLMMPRFVAGILMIPVLVVFSCFLSIFMGFAMSVLKMDISVFNFVKGMKLDFATYDVVVGLTKSVVYGGTITFIGSYVGLTTEGGAQGVGRAATAACVISSALILVLDYFLTHTMLVA